MKNHGYIYSPRDPKDYVLGGVSFSPHEVLAIDGKWKNHLPAPEKQLSDYFDTISCVSFTVCNAIEALMRRKFAIHSENSDRALAIASDTTKNGNTVTKVCEIARKILGFIPEEMLPFSEDIKSWEEYHSPNPLNKKYYDEGRIWLNKYIFQHEWVDTDPESLKEGLKYSPLGVSVLAWIKSGDYYVKQKGDNDNHFTLLVGYEEGDHWLVYDTYPASDGVFYKKLSWDYPFGIVKSFSIKKAKQSWLLKWWREILK